EFQLLNILDDLNEKNIKFALSNVLETKGKRNEILIQWSKKYNINYLNYNYNNSNYHKRDKKSNNIEVLITNY
ncbi:DNA adenine methylase, partial [Anaerosalibacter bizertensis]|nr:DNA adenine methylase [Anaerosalibacter bizertensis]